MMTAVTALLKDIERRGLPEAQFSALLASLDELEVRRRGGLMPGP